MAYTAVGGARSPFLAQKWLPGQQPRGAQQQGEHKNKGRVSGSLGRAECVSGVHSQRVGVRSSMHSSQQMEVAESVETR